MAVLNGRLTVDRLIGSAGSDKLYGDGGNDFLFGGKGADQLYGGDGNDVLVGGDRSDLLTGGAGADTFRMTVPYDSKQWGGLYDTIRDFSTSQRDRIDFSAIDANAGASGNQAFRFGAGPGEGNLWTVRQGGDTFVNANIQNGGIMTVRLDNFSGPLDSGDFFL